MKRPPSLLLLYALLWGVFLYAPVLLLPVFSFNDSTIVAFPLHGFTTQWYRQLADSPGLIAALKNSLLIAVIVAPVTTLLGLLCTWAVVRYRPPGTRAAVGIMMLPLVLPGLVLAVSLFMLVMALKIPLSVFTIGLGHLVVCLPFSISVLLSRLESFDRSLEEASRDLGENAFTTFWRIILPMAAPGIVSSLLLTFTISFDEFVVSFFLAGTETTLPVYLWSQLRFPAKLPVVLALGSLVLLVSFVMISASEVARRFRSE
ncbi:MAG: Spermidine Putrescine transporter permease [Rhizobium sp.]|nr:Spermidine Putrescine transporter permease [Rhizobium sp.]